MMFQDGALFSSLSVAENVAVPLTEHAHVPAELLDALVHLRLAQAGLGPDAAPKMPSELSGGMRKRAAIARALALEPEILFLDEPTSGLDPTTARGFDAMVRSLVDDLGITVFLVTHDLDTLLTVVDRIVVLANGKVLADGKAREVIQVDDPWIQSYFSVRTMVSGSALGTLRIDRSHGSRSQVHLRRTRGHRAACSAGGRHRLAQAHRQPQRLQLLHDLLRAPAARRTADRRRRVRCGASRSDASKTTR